MKQNLIDSARFVVKAGDGGDGIVHFRREKYVPKGGPDGGDGGGGGSIYIVADANIKTLRHFAGKDRFEARRGGHGGKRKQHGKDAEDVWLSVPVGTVVKVRSDKPKGKSTSQKFKSDDQYVELADLDEDGAQMQVARGGQGGRGNTAFKSSTNTTPREAEIGELGEKLEIALELKVLADIGLVGLPNAGKSTLLSVLTAAKPEVANYPFTTLSPNLGTVELDGGRQKSLVMADIPGLIEDAHKGKGLGIDFLKHVERCSALVYVLFPDEVMLLNAESQKSKAKNDNHNEELVHGLWRQYETVKQEVEKYGHGLEDKPVLVVVNKRDLMSNEKEVMINDYFSKKKVDVMLVSAVTTEGIEELKDLLFDLVAEV